MTPGTARIDTLELVVSGIPGVEAALARVSSPTATIGSDPSATIHVADAAGQACTLAWRPSGWYVRSGSVGVLLVNGQPLPAGEFLLRNGDHLQAGSALLTVTDTHGHGRVLDAPLRVGRAMDNDIILDRPEVASYHLEAWPTVDGQMVVRDVGDHGRTLVDGTAATYAAVAGTTSISLGTARITGADLTAQLARRQIATPASPGPALLAGRNLVRIVGHDRVILRDVDVAIRRGRFLAIAGTSGAGKSTLIKLLNGYTRPSSGELCRRPGTIGYVPQDDIIHRELSLHDAVVLSALLRFPKGTRRGVVEGRAHELFTLLGLTEHAGTRVSQLSGGQRKRASVALELMTDPELILLDEPTSGLDPASAHHLMVLLRSLAQRGYGIALITHSVADITACDQVAFLAPGGRLVFHGSSAEARQHFGVEDLELIFERIEDEGTPEGWRANFAATPMYARLVTEVETALDELRGGAGPPMLMPSAPGGLGAPVTGARRLAPAWQLRGLVRRYLEVMTSDWKNLAFLLGQVPIIVGLARVIFPGGVLTASIPSGGSADDALNGVQLLFIITATIIWLGTVNSAREICKEQAIWERERHLGIRPLPYLASKILVLAGIATVQMLILVIMVGTLWELPDGVSTLPALLGAALLTGFAATAMGLAISAMASTPDRAMTIAPVAMIPQLLFGGVIVPLSTIGAGGRALSSVIIGRWGFQAAAGVTDRAGRLGNTLATRFGADTTGGAAMVMLLALTAAFVAIAGASLFARTRRS